MVLDLLELLNLGPHPGLTELRIVHVIISKHTGTTPLAIFPMGGTEAPHNGTTPLAIFTMGRN